MVDTMDRKLVTLAKIVNFNTYMEVKTSIETVKSHSIHIANVVSYLAHK